MNESSKFTVRNESFVCIHCGTSVRPLTGGGCRNHCPECFYSLHLDIHPGDRASDCKGILEPITVESHSKKGYMIVHRCKRCGLQTKNKMALEDPVQPDNFAHLLELMQRNPGI
ncbi:RNHCP domain-containing protein [Effusibacillus dendaii]|uniref:RNHCP domain-containing protein n=1 Tax=Effusibacillus dendaii TaxID=2743772 RepID=UPI00190B6536|nr:RNHCP domain-containing protein [Effusibacillus dendaii]